MTPPRIFTTTHDIAVLATSVVQEWHNRMSPTKPLSLVDLDRIIRAWERADELTVSLHCSEARTLTVHWLNSWGNVATVLGRDGLPNYRHTGELNAEIFKAVQQRWLSPKPMTEVAGSVALAVHHWVTSSGRISVISNLLYAYTQFLEGRPFILLVYDVDMVNFALRITITPPVDSGWTWEVEVESCEDGRFVYSRTDTKSLRSVLSI